MKNMKTWFKLWDKLKDIKATLEIGWLFYLENQNQIDKYIF